MPNDSHAQNVNRPANAETANSPTSAEKLSIPASPRRTAPYQRANPPSRAIPRITPYSLSEYDSGLLMAS